MENPSQDRDALANGQVGRLAVGTSSSNRTPLFNVETDPAERFNYAADHPEIVAELVKLIEQQKAAVKPGAVQK